MRRYLILTLAAAASLDGYPAGAANPIIDDGLADPSVKVFGGRAYVYGTHDSAPTNTTWIAKDWHVYTSSDLVTWSDAGVVLDDDALAWRPSTDRDWAPDAIGVGDQYYFYFPLGDDARGVTDAIGVAAGSSPAGPFTDILGKALIGPSTTPARAIDPMAFEDADGARYLIWGNGGFYMARLNEDMKSFATSPQALVISGAPSVEEGPFVWRRGGKYYLLYSRCGAGCADSLDYAVSESLQGPYAYRGTIIAHGKAGNEHGSVFEFNGQWYVAYHDLAPTTYYRKAKLEIIHYTNGGDIPRVSPTVYGVGRHDGRKPIEAENYFDKSTGLAYEDCDDEGGGFAVTGIDDGSWLKFQQVDLGAGADAFAARVAPGAGGGRIEIRTGSADGPLVGNCDIPPGNRSWRTVEATLDVPLAGVNDLVVVFKGDGSGLLELNWIQFIGPGGVSGGGDDGCACALDARSPSRAPSAWLLAAILVAARPRRRARPGRP